MEVLFSIFFKILPHSEGARQDWRTEATVVYVRKNEKGKMGWKGERRGKQDTLGEICKNM